MNSKVITDTDKTLHNYFTPTSRSAQTIPTPTSQAAGGVAQAGTQTPTPRPSQAPHIIQQRASALRRHVPRRALRTHQAHLITSHGNASYHY
jgi:hypothetical protein